MEISTLPMPAIDAAPHLPASRSVFACSYEAVRSLSVRLCQPLKTEDYVVQPVADVSPPKWHLAHTTWFFEEMLLKKFYPDYRVFQDGYGEIFNSYYEKIGKPFPRERRGTLSRPTVDEVFAYRTYVDSAVLELLDRSSSEQFVQLVPVLELGLHHEQQHQELLVTDTKYIYWNNPLRPTYSVNRVKFTNMDHDPIEGRLNQRINLALRPDAWRSFEGGLKEIGLSGPTFGFDNERPRHSVYVAPFELARQPVTVGDYLEFIESGGYEDPGFWHAEGWAEKLSEGWQAPLYWEKVNGEWSNFTMSGSRRLNFDEPVCHVSFFEASAYAEWKGVRLPTEFEWEVAALEASGPEGVFLDDLTFHPEIAGFDMNRSLNRVSGLEGNTWEWTSSAYAPYPGFKTFDGAAAEYNGKFMCNQYVLRGGSCATPKSHYRPTYRNFFPAGARWQFAGFRLAR